MALRERWLRWLLTGLTVSQLIACSKVVSWEEEVPLNTGDVIWVKRTVIYNFQGEAGNPVKMSYQPTRAQSIEFKWHMKSFHYEGDARLMLLAISEQDEPTLVARADDNSWNSVHNYPCRTPFYVQLISSKTQGGWVWPETIEPWLYGLQKNLLLSHLDPDDMLSRYTAKQKASLDEQGLIQTPSQARIEPAYGGDSCRAKR